MLLTLQTLIDKRACPEQVELFRFMFGDSVDVTPELCERVAAQFNFEWAARSLLTGPALAEYERVSARAFGVAYCGGTK